MNRKKFMLCLSIVLATTSLFSNIALADTLSTQNTANAIRIDTKVVSLTGTIVSKPTNDGVAYVLNTSSGSFSVIGPNSKSVSTYANTDKKVTVTGNPAVGVNIIVMTSAAEATQQTNTSSGTSTQTVATSSSASSTSTTTSNAVKIDTSKVVALTGTVISRPTNDGNAYVINTPNGSFYIIGTNIKSISAYANTDKKITIKGNPTVGANAISMVSFADYVPSTTSSGAQTAQTTASTTASTGTSAAGSVRVDTSKVVSLTGTVVSKATKDGTAYILNTLDGTSFSIIGSYTNYISSYANTNKKVVISGNPAVGANILVMLKFAEYTQPVTTSTPTTLQTTTSSGISTQPVITSSGASSTSTTTSNAVKIDTSKVVALTGTVISRPTNDGNAYVINTPNGSFYIIGANVKSISAYANTDKKITIKGNPAVGANAISMVSFADYVPSTTSSGAQAAQTTASTGTSTQATTASTAISAAGSVRVDTSKIVSLTGTVVSKATKDGTAYILNTLDGTSFSIIGSYTSYISSYANTNKKVVISGNPAVGANILVMLKFAEYAQPVTTSTPTTLQTTTSTTLSIKK